MTAMLGFFVRWAALTVRCRVRNRAGIKRMLVPKPRPKTLNIAIKKQGEDGKKVTSFVDCPEAGQSFHNKHAGIGGKNQLFQPPTGAENCCSQVQQIRLSFSIPQYFTVIFFPALNHDECGGIGKPMHATHRLKE